MEPSNNRYKSICLPFESETHYRTIVEDATLFRYFIQQMITRYPELFPSAISSGFSFHDFYYSVKQDILLRRIKINSTGKTFLIRPSFLMPYLTAKTEDMEKALFLRQWGVPFDALAYVFGGDSMFYYRAWLTLGQPSIVGSSIKEVENLPKDLVADEKHTYLQGEKVYLPTTVAGGAILGITVVEKADSQALESGYGEFAEEVRQIAPHYNPETVCVDGWKATHEAWTRLFPRIKLILCFLHSLLKIVTRCRGWMREQVKQKAWRVYQANTKREFSQRLRRFKEWAERKLTKEGVQEAVYKMWEKGRQLQQGYDFGQAARTSNQVDRLINHLDRLLYSMRYFHGRKESARLAVRAMALQWNFHPFGIRTRRESNRESPFSDLNGFVYHENWLHNLLIASSMGGHRL